MEVCVMVMALKSAGHSTLGLVFSAMVTLAFWHATAQAEDVCIRTPI
tara:strand:- start:1083 stop:1223 length:141 start_codon:yes stop_codon:yes gene_type:complete